MAAWASSFERSRMSAFFSFSFCSFHFLFSSSIRSSNSVSFATRSPEAYIYKRSTYAYIFINMMI